MGLKELAEIKRVEILLDKYWQGESTREEEAALKKYFNGDNVADHLKYIQPLFVMLQQNGGKELGNNFDEDIKRRLKPKGLTSLRRSSQLAGNVVKIAATLVLVLVAIYLLRPGLDRNDNSDDQAVQLGTFDDPKEAYEQVKKSLQLVSVKLNKGSGYMQELSKFNKGATLFNHQKKQKTQD